MCVTKLSKRFELWTRDWHTVMCPTSLIAVIRLSWSGSWAVPRVEMTTSTCFNAATRLSWSLMSPCILLEYLDFIKDHEVLILWWGIPCPVFTELHKTKKKWRKKKLGVESIYFQNCDARSLEWINQLLLWGVGSCCVWANQSKGGMAQPSTRLGDELSNCSSCSNNQNLAVSHFLLFGLMGRSRPNIWRHWKTRFSLQGGSLKQRPILRWYMHPCPFLPQVQKQGEEWQTA